jgi:hypothetical protein
MVVGAIALFTLSRTVDFFYKMYRKKSIHARYIHLRGIIHAAYGVNLLNYEEYMDILTKIDGRLREEWGMYD